MTDWNNIYDPVHPVDGRISRLGSPIQDFHGFRERDRERMRVSMATMNARLPPPPPAPPQTRLPSLLHHHHLHVGLVENQYIPPTPTSSIIMEPGVDMEVNEEQSLVPLPPPQFRDNHLQPEPLNPNQVVLAMANFNNVPQSQTGLVPVPPFNEFQAPLPVAPLAIFPPTPTPTMAFNTGESDAMDLSAGSVFSPPGVRRRALESENIYENASFLLSFTEHPKPLQQVQVQPVLSQPSPTPTYSTRSVMASAPVNLCSTPTPGTELIGQQQLELESHQPGGHYYPINSHSSVITVHERELMSACNLEVNEKPELVQGHSSVIKFAGSLPAGTNQGSLSPGMEFETTHPTPISIPPGTAPAPPRGSGRRRGRSPRIKATQGRSRVETVTVELSDNEETQQPQEIDARSREELFKNAASSTFYSSNNPYGEQEQAQATLNHNFSKGSLPPNTLGGGEGGVGIDVNIDLGGQPAMMGNEFVEQLPSFIHFRRMKEVENSEQSLGLAMQITENLEHVPEMEDSSKGKRGRGTRGKRGGRGEGANSRGSRGRGRGQNTSVVNGTSISSSDLILAQAQSILKQHLERETSDANTQQEQVVLDSQIRGRGGRRGRTPRRGRGSRGARGSRGSRGSAAAHPISEPEMETESSVSSVEFNPNPVMNEPQPPQSQPIPQVQIQEDPAIPAQVFPPCVSSSETGILQVDPITEPPCHNQPQPVQHDHLSSLARSCDASILKMDTTDTPTIMEIKSVVKICPNSPDIATGLTPTQDSEVTMNQPNSDLLRSVFGTSSPSPSVPLALSSPRNSVETLKASPSVSVPSSRNNVSNSKPLVKKRRLVIRKDLNVGPASSSERTVTASINVQNLTSGIMSPGVTLPMFRSNLQATEQGLTPTTDPASSRKLEEGSSSTSKPVSRNKAAAPDFFNLKDFPRKPLTLNTPGLTSDIKIKVKEEVEESIRPEMTPISVENDEGLTAVKSEAVDSAEGTELPNEPNVAIAVAKTPVGGQDITSGSKDDSNRSKEEGDKITTGKMQKRPRFRRIKKMTPRSSTEEPDSLPVATQRPSESASFGEGDTSTRRTTRSRTALQTSPQGNKKPKYVETSSEGEYSSSEDYKYVCRPRTRTVPLVKSLIKSEPEVSEEDVHSVSIHSEEEIESKDRKPKSRRQSISSRASNSSSTGGGGTNASKNENIYKESQTTSPRPTEIKKDINLVENVLARLQNHLGNREIKRGPKAKFPGLRRAKREREPEMVTSSSFSLNFHSDYSPEERELLYGDKKFVIDVLGGDLQPDNMFIWQIMKEDKHLLQYYPSKYGGRQYHITSGIRWFFTEEDFMSEQFLQRFQPIPVFVAVEKEVFPATETRKAMVDTIIHFPYQDKSSFNRCLKQLGKIHKTEHLLSDFEGMNKALSVLIFYPEVALPEPKPLGGMLEEILSALRMMSEPLMQSREKIKAAVDQVLKAVITKGLLTTETVKNVLTFPAMKYSSTNLKKRETGGRTCTACPERKQPFLLVTFTAQREYPRPYDPRTLEELEGDEATKAPEESFYWCRECSAVARKIHRLIHFEYNLHRVIKMNMAADAEALKKFAKPLPLTDVYLMWAQSLEITWIWDHFLELQVCLAEVEEITMTTLVPQAVSTGEEAHARESQEDGGNQEDNLDNQSESNAISNVPTEMEIEKEIPDEGESTAEGPRARDDILPKPEAGDHVPTVIEMDTM